MIKNLLKIIRLDKPIGIVLLLSPTLWALWFAHNFHPPIKLVLIFTIGAIFMRSAGCVINDITDQDLDGKVARTKNRVLVTKQITNKTACALAIILIMCSGVLLLFLPKVCTLYALISLCITIIYPWGKRFISAPQVILGFAFSMGMPMAWATSGKNFDMNFYILFIMNILWVIAYDTEYAMVDKAYDLKNNIRSTAILFAKYDVSTIITLLCLTNVGWLVLMPIDLIFTLFYLTQSAIIYKQYLLIKNRTDNECFRAFMLNGWYGTVTILFLICKSLQNVTS